MLGREPNLYSNNTKYVVKWRNVNNKTADIPETWWEEKNLLTTIQWNKISNNDQKNTDYLVG